MRSMHGDARIGVFTGGLPRGCSLCYAGTKVVVFVTGLCRDGCYYCPVSRSRMGQDRMYVDEEPVDSPSQVLLEAYRIGASGASITGGDPLARPARVLTIIRALKSEFGDGFHIHLYTSGRLASRSLLERLEATGLDEIRFHPTHPSMLEKVRIAVEHTGMDVGVEVPAIPGREQELIRLAERLEEMGAKFLNLNEMEVSESNIEAVTRRGFRVAGSGVAVEGSRETALKVVRWAAGHLKRLKVHFCPAGFKDYVQTKNRLLRKARGVAHLYEEPTREGTLLRGEILLSRVSGRAAKLVEEGLLVPLGGSMYATHPALLDKVLDMLSPGEVGEAWVAEYHPTLGRMLVSRRRVA